MCYHLLILGLAPRTGFPTALPFLLEERGSQGEASSALPLSREVLVTWEQAPLNPRHCSWRVLWQTCTACPESGPYENRCGSFHSPA